MPTVKLTQRVIDRLAAPTESKKQELYFDVDLRGFAVLCSGVSATKTYICQRAVGGKTRRVTVGAVNEITLAEARERAAPMLDDLRMGRDPKAKVAAPLTLQAALDGYLRAKGDRLRPRSVEGYRSSLERYLADWADLPVSSITGPLVEARHRELGNEKGHATANATMRTLSAVLNWARVRNPDMPANPVQYLKGQWFTVQRREGLVKVDELPRFWKALCELENPIGRDFLKLLLLSGLRRREASGLTWADVDLAGRVIRIPASRMKAGRAFALPMSKPVHDLLVSRRSLGDTKWVFPGHGKSGHVEEPKSFLRDVAQASGVSVSAHDLRRTFSSVAQNTPGVSFMALKGLIAHSSGGGVTEGYAIVSPADLAEAAERVGARMAELCQIESLPESVARL